MLGFTVFKEMLQTPENSAFNKNRSRKSSGNNLTGNANKNEYSTTTEPKHKTSTSTLLRTKAGDGTMSGFKRITGIFKGKLSLF